MPTRSDTKRQNETVPSASQDLAIQAILTGATIKDSAEAAKVSRSTVHRWLRDPDFLIEYVRVRTELREAQQRRIASIASAALDVVEQALNEGDQRVAVSVLKGVGLLSGVQPDTSSFEDETVRRDRAQKDRANGLVDLLASVQYRTDPAR